MVQGFEELRKRLSPQNSLGSMMRNFQKTERGAEWGSASAKKKHLKRMKAAAIRPEGTEPETEFFGQMVPK
jgi:hypothetical protein